MVVGGSDDQGTDVRTDDTIFVRSSWRNPTTPNGDRELPEIVAPGYFVDGAGITNSGTSASAPIITGLVAAMLERNSTLASWPEAQKAILLASADCNTDGTTLDLTDTTDDRDGVGLVNGVRAVELADSSNRVQPFNFATAQGYDYGYMDFTSDFVAAGSSREWQQRYTIFTGATGVVNLAFTWDATPDCPQNTEASCQAHAPDGDLNVVLRNTQFVSPLVVSSMSYDNNYEVIQAALAAYSEYEVIVSRAFNPRRSSTYFGLAWRTVDSNACPESF
jgi:hypothetical protein